MDFETVKRLFDYNPTTGIFTWRVMLSSRGLVGSRAGTKLQHGYWALRVNSTGYLAHRLAWLWMTGKMPDQEIDHINGIRDDNRWINLREATHTQNCYNMQGRKPGSKGIHQANGKWRAAIKASGKTFRLGTFTTKEDAQAAYDVAATEHHGDYRRKI